MVRENIKAKLLLVLVIVVVLILVYVVDLPQFFQPHINIIGPRVLDQKGESWNCRMRTDRSNPYLNAADYDCKNFILINISAPKVVRGLIDKVSTTKTKEGHFMYENIMIFPGGRIQMLTESDIHAKTQCHWIEETVLLWYNQPVSMISHGCHNAYALPKMHLLFAPYRTQLILFVHENQLMNGGYFKGQFKKYDFGPGLMSPMCDLLRSVFDQEGYVLPQMWTIPYLYEKGIRPVCLRRALQQDTYHAQNGLRLGEFRSHEDTDRFRRLGLKMCGVEPRKVLPRTKVKNVFFFQRGWTRLILNANNLCMAYAKEGYNAYFETDDARFCTMVKKIHAADVIVAVEGSHGFLLYYAAPGAVTIFAPALNIRGSEATIHPFLAEMNRLDIMLPKKYHVTYEDSMKILLPQLDKEQQKTANNLDCF